MPEPTQLKFSHKEVATALIKAHNLHDGIWGLYINFGIRGMNVGGGDDDLQPTALVPILSIGLQQFPTVNNLSVDAAVVNPKQSAQKLIGSGSTREARKKRRQIKSPRRNA